MRTPEPHSGERASRQYSFGDFTLDLDRGALFRGSGEVQLRAKPFEVLTYLVQHHGRLLTKAAITEAVWPDTAVMDNSLSQCLVEIRRALGDDSQQMIRTVARRGYLFAAPVSTPVLEFPQHPVIASAPPPARGRAWLDRKFIFGVAFIFVAAVVALGVVRLSAPTRQELTYEQLTHFTDSAVSPALSPDGRMLAFLRSDSWFQSPDQIYVKLLPNGEPVQVTNDPRPKYGLAFSPDGSRIAYATAQAGVWKISTVPSVGGGTTELLTNAAGLTWLDQRRVLFSEISTGVHMGMVTATENRSEYRKIYFPQDERGMVHLSYASPDRKWALAVEMNPVWQPCRLVPLDGSSAGRPVGPAGNCTSAAWSPDGRWMYFGVAVAGKRHLWRQRFPEGEPEQITSGPTEEEGVAVAPDGRSLVTAVGIHRSSVWIHDARGDRPLSTDGYVVEVERSGIFGAAPKFSGDGESVFYLKSESPGAAMGLWRTNLAAEKSQALVREFSILEYDISSDGKDIAFSTQPSGKPVHIWVTAMDRGSAPRMISSSGGDSPHFGPGGQVVFRPSDGTRHYLARMNRDGSDRSKIAPYPIGNIEYISPDRSWISTISPAPEGSPTNAGGTLAVPTEGGAPRWICRSSGLPAVWAPDGKFLYVSLERRSRSGPGKSFAIPIPSGQALPNLPPQGVCPLDAEATFTGAHVIEAWNVSPGPDPSVYAYVKATTQRNLFRIPLRAD